MGFEEERVLSALEATGATNLEILAGWLLENADRPVALLPVFPAVFVPSSCARAAADSLCVRWGELAGRRLASRRRRRPCRLQSSAR